MCAPLVLDQDLQFALPVIQECRECVANNLLGLCKRGAISLSATQFMCIGLSCLHLEPQSMLTAQVLRILLPAGCSHFIIGRDMAGSKSSLTGTDFYGAYDAQVRRHAGGIEAPSDMEVDV